MDSEFIEDVFFVLLIELDPCRKSSVVIHFGSVKDAEQHAHHFV